MLLCILLRKTTIDEKTPCDGNLQSSDVIDYEQFVFSLVCSSNGKKEIVKAGSPQFPSSGFRDFFSAAQRTQEENYIQIQKISHLQDRALSFSSTTASSRLFMFQFEFLNLSSAICS